MPEKGRHCSQKTLTQSESTAGDNSAVGNTGKQRPRLMTYPVSQSVSPEDIWLLRTLRPLLVLFLGPLSHFVLSELSCLFSQCSDNWLQLRAHNDSEKDFPLKLYLTHTLIILISAVVCVKCYECFGPLLIFKTCLQYCYLTCMGHPLIAFVQQKLSVT